jgi:glutathione S-transferase
MVEQTDRQHSDTQYGISPLLMGLLVVHGAQARGFSPISTYGVIVNGLVVRAEHPQDEITLFLGSLAFNLVLGVMVFVLFGGLALLSSECARPTPRGGRRRVRVYRPNEERDAPWCGELSVPYHRIDVGGPFGGNREPEYLRLNPNGLVPTISDDGFVPWESNAIVRYLAARHAMGTLCPENLAERADADKWMDWQMGTLWTNLHPAFIGLIRTPAEKRDRASVAAAVRKTAENLAILDAHLTGRDYVTGSSFTMTDIPLGATAYRWFSLDIERAPMSNLEAWYERLCARLPYRANVMLPLS